MKETAKKEARQFVVVVVVSVSVIVFLLLWFPVSIAFSFPTCALVVVVVMSNKCNQPKESWLKRCDQTHTCVGELWRGSCEWSLLLEEWEWGRDSVVECIRVCRSFYHASTSKLFFIPWQREEVSSALKVDNIIEIPFSSASINITSIWKIAGYKHLGIDTSICLR